VEALGPRVMQLVDELLDEVAAHGSPVDLVAHFAEPLPIMVICELLGVPYDDRPRLRAWAARLMSSSGYTAEEIIGAVTQIREYLGILVAAKRSEPGDDLITELVRVTDDEDALTETELLANLQLLLIAGHETTVNQLGNSLVALFRHPDQLALLRDRLELIELAVDELIRYVRLSLPVLPRIAMRDVEVDGVAIKAGDGVIAMSAAANRDPSVFTDPDRFDVTRPANPAHLAFGFGEHLCLGASLARLEARAFLEQLLARFPDFTVTGEPTWTRSTLVRGHVSLPAVLA
jgi:cytochrome P450